MFIIALHFSFGIKAYFYVNILKTMLRFSFLMFLFLVPQLIFSTEKDSCKNNKTTPNKLTQPSHLKKGDTILILAPAGRITGEEAIEAGIELATKWGLEVIYGKHLYTINNTFAGTDEQRLGDLQNALDNPNIKAIWSARGGYGLVRIIDDLDFTEFKKHPKWIIGYSDVTILHNKLHNLGYQTIHGQMPATLDLDNPIQEKSIISLKKTLFGEPLKYKLPASERNRKGKSNGQLVGGNLSILYSMLGSDTSLDTSGKILFIEDIGEALYHIDRIMISLKRAGYFKNCKGLIVGDFRLKKNEGNTFGKTLEDIVLEAVEGTDFPVVFNFPAGHVDDNRALVLGARIELNVTENKVNIKFD
ncbi:MAG: LD-carboxypeptidase [Lutibacter sp.]|nr:MAG: LD-carboxypeptidase [Lutibacter sp.]